SGIWQSMGWNSIIYVAALSSVDPSLYEAASVDGASRFRQLITIDLPSILPTAILLLIMNAGSVMNVGFEKTFLMQNDLNLTTSEVISTYLYKVGMTGRTDFGYSTAIGLFNSIVNFILIVTVNKISTRLSDQGLW
ncbi:MAG: sugar ABC transporter permease, partial [Clostridia bacterium]|nr:sugar ABC transporter permease [Clostridia bacterium]